MLNGLTNPKVEKPTKAVWRVNSKLNKNWNDSGAFIYKGMRGVPMEISYRIEELKLQYGEPPEDLEWGFTLSKFGVKYFWHKMKGPITRIFWISVITLLLFLIVIF